MSRILIHQALCVATCDHEDPSQSREIRNGAVYIVDHSIQWVGPSTEIDPSWWGQATEVIDAKGCLVTPGLINTHHHMYQSLTRVVKDVQDAELFSWLQGLYPIWAGLTPDMIFTSTQTAMAELMLSGCTTSSDHLYLYPNGAKLDDSIEAAQQMGMRFVACRGSMSVGQSQGGLPPDALVENEAHILQDSQRLIEAWHDSSHGAMVQIALAPCSPFSVSTQLMQQSAELARSFKGQGVRLHTHLAENDHDMTYSQARFGKTPTQYVEDLGWVGPDVWHAHCVKLDEEGVYLFAKTGTGVAHCPCSNMRLASGIAPIRSMLNAGVAVGLGVDGSASNDSGNLLNEARQAMLVARVNRALQAPSTQNGQTFFGCDLGPKEMTARDALHLATRGSAKVLGRQDIGYLAPGMCADIALFDLQTTDYAGAAIHDPVASLMFCHSNPVKHALINGVVKVKNGALVALDLEQLLNTHNRMAWQLLNPS